MIDAFILWFLIGAVLLLFTVVAVYKTRVVYMARERSGLLKKRIPLSGLITMLVFLAVMAGFFIGYDVYCFGRAATQSIIEIALYNFILLAMLSLFDAFIVDYMIIGKWKPAFLHIPKEITTNSMINHIKKQLSVGWIIKASIAVFSAFLYILIFQR